MQLLAANPELLSGCASNRGSTGVQATNINPNMVTPVKPKTQAATTGTNTRGASKTPTSNVRQLNQGGVSTPAILAPDSNGALGQTMAFMHAHSHHHGQDGVADADDVDIDALRQTAQQLRAVVFIVSPHPTLRRVLLSHGAEFVEYLADAIRYSQECQAILRARMVAEEASGHRQEGESQNEIMDVVLAVDEAVLGTLETIAQVDITEGLLTVRQYQQFQQLHVPQHGEILAFVLPSIQHKCSFLDRIISVLLPTTIELLSHPDGDIRVIIASTLRKLLPLLLRTASTLSIHSAAYGVDELLEDKVTASQLSHVATCLSNPSILFKDLYPKISAVLVDQAPIPQFGVRMLLDSIVCVSSNDESLLNILNELRRHGCINVLIQMLKIGAANTQAQQQDSSNNAENQLEQDPQLVVLLRALFERSQQTHPEAPHVVLSMLESELTQAIVSAVNSYVPIGGIVAVDVLMPLLELMYSVLSFIFRSQQQQASNTNTAAGARVNVDLLRKHAHPLRGLCGWLFGVLLATECRLSYVELPLWCKDSNDDDNAGKDLDQERSVGSSNDSGNSNMSQIMDFATRCLGLLFDIFPDAVMTLLLGNNGGDSEAPKRIVAQVLLNPKVI
jgi:hypothetical protein